MMLERKLKIFIYARIIVSLVFLASTFFMSFKAATSPENYRMGMLLLMVCSFLFSIASLVALKLRYRRTFIAYLQTIWDLLFVSLLLLFTGGVLSPYSFLYLLSIMNAAVLLGRREAIYTACLCGILYGTLVDFQYFGMLSAIGLDQSTAQRLGASSIFYTIFLNFMSFILTALITGFISARARETEEALLIQTINYDEMERLNSSIVNSLESGLITVTPAGMIRVFNPYASEISGKDQQEVYDTPLAEIFPIMADILRSDDHEKKSGEFEYKRRGADRKILGFNAYAFNDTLGKESGFIINFKDLTTIKRMETALKKTDRLAALGELSARMAHEIRNPLAAMTGSVQLLAEHGSIGDNDRKLLNIVQREADRLNLLISEFLAYARPAMPEKQRIELRPLLEEMILLLSSDPRFKDIVIHDLVTPHMLVQADINQFRQVLLNLFTNAAEAMPDGKGKIEVEACFQLSGADGFEKSPVAVISITDTGHGIDPSTASHLFEPFWTTKPEGSGLGLAITYRIIEAHGGSISVETPPKGGCRFAIMLPV